MWVNILSVSWTSLGNGVFFSWFRIVSGLWVLALNVFPYFSWKGNVFSVGFR
jgi:hypothetical protein